jgi:hypothetical protein
VTAAAGKYSQQIIEVLDVPADYVRMVITDYKYAYRIDPTISEVEILPSGHVDVVRVQILSEQYVGPFCIDMKAMCRHCEQ